MRVLITGGAGFIGSALARAYAARDARVYVVDSLVTGRPDQLPSGVELIQRDIRDPKLESLFISLQPLDVVSHHAALKDVRQALVDPRADADINVLGTVNVLRCARAAGARRVLYASSAATYGDAAVLPTPESAPPAPISPYGISKAAAEAYGAYFARSLGLPVVALRYGTVYGPHAGEQTEAGVITIFTRRMLAGQRPVIFGDGKQSRDLVYVDDVVRANLLAAERAPRPWAVYNVATGVETTINALYRQLAKAAGYAEPPEYLASKPGEVRRNIQTTELIRRELGWQANVPLAEGLARIVAAHRAELAAA